MNALLTQTHIQMCMLEGGIGADLPVTMRVLGGGTFPATQGTSGPHFSYAKPVLTGFASVSKRYPAVGSQMVIVPQLQLLAWRNTTASQHATRADEHHLTCTTCLVSSPSLASILAPFRRPSLSVWATRLRRRQHGSTTAPYRAMSQQVGAERHVSEPPRLNSIQFNSI